MQDDLTIVVSAYLITCWWQVISWPMAIRLFPNLPDKGWAMSRFLGSALVGLAIWELASLGLAVNTDFGLQMMMIGLTAVAVILIYRQKQLFMTDKKSLGYVLISEVMFGFGFLGMSAVRAFAPQIHSLEKLMDFGFVKQYLLSPTLPARDMWFAGESINYYSFGHYWASIWIRSWRVDPATGYNLALALIFGMLISMSFILIVSLNNAASEKAKVYGGILGSILIGLGGNTHTLWYFVSHNWSLNGYWYAEATRFIHNTIHEFPSYSFVVSDLHGHVLSLPLVLCFMIVLFYWFKNQTRVLEILMGGLVGIMMMTNTWDVAVYGLLTGIVCLLGLVSKKINLGSVLKAGLLILGTAILIALPWAMGFKPISDGVRLVVERSPWWQLLVLWSGGAVAVVLAMVLGKRDEQKQLIWALGLCAVALILIPEFVYAKDIYPTHPRANTMFKLTYQGFIMMGLLTGVVFTKLATKINRSNWWWKSVVWVGFSGIFVGSMMFPFKAFPAYYGNFQDEHGLNGEYWMRIEMPEKYAAIEFLREQTETGNMVEAVGDSYTDYNMVSVFSGIPTVVGWRVHEWLWRGGYGVVGSRDTEVKNFYEDDDIEKTREMIGKYQIRWILIGPEEQNKYQINYQKLKELADIVWNEGETTILKVKP